MLVLVLELAVAVELGLVFELELEWGLGFEPLFGLLLALNPALPWEVDGIGREGGVV